MARTWPAKWNPPKYWRLCATASDGLTVTLGRYETAEQANEDCGRMTQLGGYLNLAVQPIAPRPDPAVDGN